MTRRSRVEGQGASLGLWGLAVVGTLFWVVGCAPSVPQGYDWAKISSSMEFEIGPGDVLQVDVWGKPELTKEARVRPDGYIDLPLVGEVKAAEQTPEELKAVIVARMETYEKNPTVTVSLKEVRSYKVYVLGKVAKPGVYQVPEKLTVLQALSLAGGLTPFAAPDEAVVLRRQGAVEVRYPFVYSLVLGGQVPEMNIVLASGDTVVVP